MNGLSAILRLTIGLVCLSVSALLCTVALGLVPDRNTQILEGRAALAETIAINSSLFAARGDAQALLAGLRAVTSRNPDILSAALRRADGGLLEVGEHQAHWRDAQTADDQIYVPIMLGEEQWGALELRFRPVAHRGFWGMCRHPHVLLALVYGALSFVIFFLYLRKMLEHLDPARVIPSRVRATLDTLAEGLLVLDKSERIVLANEAFAKTTGHATGDLQGRKVTELPWLCKADEAAEDFPWRRSMREKAPQTGIMLGLRATGDSERTFMVNSAPICGEDGDYRGALASFDDVTQLEEKNLKLVQMLELLKESRDEIHRQNEQLQALATRDPLTSCLNRRAFFAEFDTLWAGAQRYEHPLSCIMLDVDRFKSINDKHGHSVGDLVLQQVAALLASTARDCDLVCRYGGEEFAVLLPHTDLIAASQAAERFRQAIESQRFQELRITASLGVSAASLGAKSPQELIDQADKAQYAAKRSGRNRVVRWDEVPEGMGILYGGPAMGFGHAADADISIPFHAVPALLSALAYRDPATAEHSRRVADLCVATASGLMSVSDCYVLEIAALLHDIGKIGVPDSILLKPGPLTEEEWKVMKLHDRIGVEIIRTSFASEELTTIVESHHTWFSADGLETAPPERHDIPLAARILTIADAYDAMVSDRVYCKGRTQEEAFSELRRCAGTHFDPDMVQRFIGVVSSIQARDLAAPHVSKQVALRIGLQIEHLASALDGQDRAHLEAMVTRLRETAARDGVHPIADRAARLERALADGAELMEIVQLTTDLLDLCRSTQGCYISNVTIPRSPHGHSSSPQEAEPRLPETSGEVAQLVGATESR